MFQGEGGSKFIVLWLYSPPMRAPLLQASLNTAATILQVVRYKCHCLGSYTSVGRLQSLLTRGLANELQTSGGEIWKMLFTETRRSN